MRPPELRLSVLRILARTSNPGSVPSTFTMLRELFVIPGLNLPIYGYGAMLVVAVLLAIQLAKFLCKRFGINHDHFYNLAFVALLSGIVGARISHVLENWSVYTDASKTVTQNLFAMINLRQGGLTYYGGFLLAVPSGLVYGLWNKMPILRSLDITAACLMVGLGVGRIGCLFNGCCWGSVCDVPWAMQFPYDSPPYISHVEEGRLTPPVELLFETDSGQQTLMSRQQAAANPRTALLARGQHSLPVHPTQIYSFITAMLIAGLCVAILTLSPRPGLTFGIMLMCEGAGRFAIELLRREPGVLGGLSISMVIGVALIVAGVVMVGVLMKLKPVLDDSPGVGAEAIELNHSQFP
jgi:phosphatidylglycerol---prolipoprotein diacylglyceryl transferase